MRKEDATAVYWLEALRVWCQLPCLMIRPARCSRSAGRHGISRSWTAISRFCTLVPVPIFAVEPSRTRISPLRTLSKRSAFCCSVLASWIYAISSAGIPLAISLSRISSETTFKGYKRYQAAVFRYSKYVISILIDLIEPFYKKEYTFYNLFLVK